MCLSARDGADRATCRHTAGPRARFRRAAHGRIHRPRRDAARSVARGSRRAPEPAGNGDTARRRRRLKGRACSRPRRPACSNHTSGCIYNHSQGCHRDNSKRGPPRTSRHSPIGRTTRRQAPPFPRRPFRRRRSFLRYRRRRSFRRCRRCRCRPFRRCCSRTRKTRWRRRCRRFRCRQWFRCCRRP